MLPEGRAASFHHGIITPNKEKKMQAHQERVVTEKSELDEKIVKLTAFIYGGSIYSTLPQGDQNLMLGQLQHMQQYSNVLATRIANFRAQS